MRVLYFYNWGYLSPIGSGADLVATNQLEYFRRRGWSVDCILGASPDREHREDAFRRRYPWLKTLTTIEIPAASFSFRDQLLAFHRAAHRPEVREALSRPADLFFTNYVFTAPLLEALPDRCPRVLEAVDIMTHSFALNEEIHRPGRDPLARSRDAFLFRTEMELYGLFDKVILINADEYERTRAFHPSRVHYVPPMYPEGANGDSGEPVLKIGGGAESAEFDLIFIGSDAAANVRGFTWFYENVFVPYLRKHGVRIGVAGRVGAKLEFDDGLLTKLGRVEGSLESLYARSRLVVVPILEGSGLSIKTMESLRMGRATVTTPAGARGLQDDPEAFIRIDMQREPQQTADVILRLLNSHTDRERMEHSAREYFENCFSATRYFKLMDEVMAPLGLAA